MANEGMSIDEIREEQRQTAKEGLMVVAKHIARIPQPQEPEWEKYLFDAVAEELNDQLPETRIPSGPSLMLQYPIENRSDIPNMTPAQLAQADQQLDDFQVIISLAAIRDLSNYPQVDLSRFHQFLLDRVERDQQV